MATTVSESTKQLSIMKKQAKQIDEQICSSLLQFALKVNDGCTRSNGWAWSVVRRRGLVWFTEGFVVDTQARLDDVNELVASVKQLYGNKIAKIEYRFRATSKWRHSVGPKTEVLPTVHDGDIRWVVIDVIMEDHDLR